HPVMFAPGVLEFLGLSAAEQANFVPACHRLVRIHPVPGRRSLFLAAYGEDAPMPETDGLLRDLIEHATQRCFVWSHELRRDDLVMWDNRTTMHRFTNAELSHGRD